MLNGRQKLLYPLRQINKWFWSSNIRIAISNANYRAQRQYYVTSKKAMPDKILKRHIVESMAKAFVHYYAKPYEGKMIVFRSPCLYDDPSLGWTPIIKDGITSFDVPGEYKAGNAIFQKPYVGPVADELKKYLLS